MLRSPYNEAVNMSIQWSFNEAQWVVKEKELILVSRAKTKVHPDILEGNNLWSIFLCWK